MLLVPVFQSQLDVSLTSGSADQGVSVSQAESKPVKAPHSSQVGKTTPGTKVRLDAFVQRLCHYGRFNLCLFIVKVSVSEARRTEEESSFWKISAERSRLEGEKADFQSLTPSQIKSLEKGEKPLPSYLRQVSVDDQKASALTSHFAFTTITITSLQDTAKEPDAAETHPPAPTKSTKQRAPKPPAPQPPVAVSATPASISISPNPPPPLSVSSTVAGWERSQSTLPSVSNAPDEMFSSSMMSKPSASPAGVEKEEDGSHGADASPTFSQVSSQTAKARDRRADSLLPHVSSFLGSSTQAAAS